METRPTRSRWLWGCGGCSGLLFGTGAVCALAVVVALWRRPGDAVAIEVELVGASVEPGGDAELTYRPETDIPFLTRPIIGPRWTFDTREPVRLVDGRASMTAARAMHSIRNEWLSYVQIPVGGDSIMFAGLRGPFDFGPPELRTGGSVSPLEHATREGDLAILRTHALFVPSTIYYDREVSTVRAVIDVRPISVTRLVPDDVEVWAPPGGSVTLRIRVRRTGGGLAGARLDVGPVSDAPAELVVTPLRVLAEELGWAIGSTPFVPVTRAQWSALRARHDARYVVSASGGDLRAFAVQIPPEEPAEEMHALVVAFEPGDDLAAAAETALVPVNPGSHDE